MTKVAWQEWLLLARAPMNPGKLSMGGLELLVGSDAHPRFWHHILDCLKGSCRKMNVEGGRGSFCL